MKRRIRAKTRRQRAACITLSHIPCIYPLHVLMAHYNTSIDIGLRRFLKCARTLMRRLNHPSGAFQLYISQSLRPDFSIAPPPIGIPICGALRMRPHRYPFPFAPAH